MLVRYLAYTMLRIMCECVFGCVREARQLSVMFDQITIYVYMRANTTYVRVSSYKVRRSQNCSVHLQQAQFMIDSRSAGAFNGTNLLRGLTNVNKKTGGKNYHPQSGNGQNKTLSSATYNTPASHKVVRAHTIYVIKNASRDRVAKGFNARHRRARKRSTFNND